MSEDQTTTIIEIQGVKMEIDLRQAKQVNTLRVGDRCKLLTTGQYSGNKVHRGVVIGFEPFETLPTIIVAYLEVSYSSAELKFAYINAKTKDFELVKSIDDDEAGIEKADVLKFFEREIAKKETEIRDLEEKREYFLTKFRTYWEPVRVAESAVDGDEAH